MRFHYPGKPKCVMKNSLILIVSLSLFTSCASDHHGEFTAFNDQRVWPTTKGAVTDDAYIVPVYRDWPERPYRVLGSVQFGKKNDWRDEDTARAALVSKNKGGDARRSSRRSATSRRTAFPAPSRVRSPATTTEVSITTLFIQHPIGCHIL